MRKLLQGARGAGASFHLKTIRSRRKLEAFKATKMWYVRTSCIALAVLTAVPSALLYGQRTRIGNGETVPNGAMLPPQILSSTPPLYTAEALTRRIEGTVIVEAAVDVHGAIGVVRVVKGLGYGLDDNAVLALRNWTFTPARRNGASVSAICQIEIDFKLPNDGVFKVGGGVAPPKVLTQIPPQYTDEARAAHYNGTVVVEAIVRQDGTLDVIRIVRGLDYGLTERAIEALKQWKFDPAVKNGKAVAVSLNIEVNFHLKQ